MNIVTLLLKISIKQAATSNAFSKTEAITAIWGVQRSWKAARSKSR